MNARERFERIIATIEARVLDPFVSKEEIASEIARDNLMDVRELTTVFRFLTDMTLRQYIMERKMMASYALLLSQSEKNLEAAAELAGYDLQTYTKKCSKLFGFPPGEAFKRKDATLLTPPLSWAAVSGHVSDSRRTVKEAATAQPLVFGISQKQYDVIAEAQNLCAYYDFSLQIGQYAYNLSRTLNQPMSRVFAYFDSIRDLLENTTADTDEIELSIRSYGSSTFHRQMYFERGITPSLIELLRDRHNVSQEEIRSLDPHMLVCFADTYDMSFAFYKRAWEYYQNHADKRYTQENFEQFVDIVDKGVPIETAFDAIDVGGNYAKMEEFANGPDAGIDEEEVDAFERWAAQESEWNEERFDEDIDMDNVAYENDDQDAFDF